VFDSFGSGEGVVVARAIVDAVDKQDQTIFVNNKTLEKISNSSKVEAIHPSTLVKMARQIFLSTSSHVLKSYLSIS
jgi:hypothetical protein